MLINEELITYLEELSYITLSETEKEQLTQDLMNILSHMSRINEIDTTEIPERSHPFDDVNAFRDDETRESLPRELILQNAPEKNEKMFIAPRTLF